MENENHEIKERNWNKLIISIFVAISSMVLGFQVFSVLVEVEASIKFLSAGMTGIVMYILLQFFPDEKFEWKFRRRGLMERWVDDFLGALVIIALGLVTFVNWYIIQFILGLVL